MSFPFFKNKSASFFEPIVLFLKSSVFFTPCILLFLSFRLAKRSASSFCFSYLLACDKCFLFNFYNKLLLKLPKLFAKIQNNKAKLNICCQLNHRQPITGCIKKKFTVGKYSLN